MNWRVKGVVQKVLSSVPGGVWVNDRLQTSVGELRNFEKIVDTKVVGDWIVLMNHFRELNIRIQGLDILEIGSGWFPTLPLCFHLVGVNSCRTFDLVRHLNGEQTFRALSRLEHHLDAIVRASGEPREVIENRYRALRSATNLIDLLKRAGIEYFAPADATRTGLANNSVDMVYSNSVLEHVPGPVIGALMEESHRILRPGGCSVHSVACNDHYAHFDRSISFINFLKFTESEWRLWNNDLNYQNRLRAPDFLQLAERAGLTVIYQKSKLRPELLEHLQTIRVAPEFSRYTPEELCTLSIDFVAQKNSVGPLS
jgi:SAM-dependent methyltransferase